MKCPSCTCLTDAGKSVLCSQLIRHLRTHSHLTVAFFICNFRTAGLNTCSVFLRAITTHLIKQNQALVGFVYDDYISKGLTASKSNLKRLIPDLLSGIPSTRVVVDGLDECLEAEQNEVLNVLHLLADTKPGAPDCRVAVFSRDLPEINKKLKKSPAISLSGEHAAVEKSINAYVHHELQEIYNNLDGPWLDVEVFSAIERRMVAKADGKVSAQLSRCAFLTPDQACSSGCAWC